MSENLPAKPHPDMTAESRPYWEGLRQHKLLLQRCVDCGRIRHYPRPLCDACHSFACDWVESRGEARVHSWMVAHHPYHPSFRQDLPFTLITADLAEGVRLLAPLRDAEADALQPGQRLLLAFEEVDPELTLPVFRLVADA